jgi:hypothetical protein
VCTLGLAAGLLAGAAMSADARALAPLACPVVGFPPVGTIAYAWSRGDQVAGMRMAYVFYETRRSSWS